MDILTQLKHQAEQVEVVNLQNEKTTVEYEANQLKICTVAETSGTAIRVVRKGRLGFSASTDATTLDKLASNALESAAYGDMAPFSFPTARSAPAVRTFDPAIAELPIDRLVDIGKEILDMVLPLEDGLRCNIGLDRSLLTASIRNQTGLDVSFKTSPLSIGVDIDRIEGDDVLIIFDQFGTTLWEKDYLEFVRRLVEKFKLARTITTIKPGKMPVLFSPTGALALMFPLSEALNGKEVYKGTSPVGKKIGEKLFDEKISLYDDGTIDGKFASASYDDEGVPRQRTPLVEKGVLKNFIYDLKTAAQAGVASTGNASRQLFAPPATSFTNLVLQPGQTPSRISSPASTKASWSKTCSDWVKATPSRAHSRTRSPWPSRSNMAKSSAASRTCPSPATSTTCSRMWLPSVVRPTGFTAPSQPPTCSSPK